MKERPILFSAPMVRAILDGTKTQTRRDVRVAIVETLEYKHGVCLCDGPSPLIMVRPDDEYPLHLLIAHELGHEKGVTRHADGSVWIRKEVK